MNVTGFTVFLLDTGEIVSHGTYTYGEEGAMFQVSGMRLAYPPDTHDVMLEDSDPRTQFVQVSDGMAALQPRPVLRVQVSRTEILSGGIDDAELTGLPDPCTIYVDADDPMVETAVHEISGGGFIFAAETPGDYTLQIDRFPFLPLDVRITAT